MTTELLQCADRPLLTELLQCADRPLLLLPTPSASAHLLRPLLPRLLNRALVLRITMEEVSPQKYTRNAKKEISMGTDDTLRLCDQFWVQKFIQIQ